MAKFKNVGDSVHVGRPALYGGQLVEAGDVYEVDGDVSSETEDAYVVGEGDEQRVWPKVQWELVKPPAKAKS